jgi:hypothetical protein
MRYAVHHIRRPGLTRDLPFGPEDLFWVVNTATLIYGERDAVLVDTYATVEQNRALVEWVRPVAAAGAGTPRRPLVRAGGW